MKVWKPVLLMVLIGFFISLGACNKKEGASPNQTSENNANKKAVGQSANDLLSADKFTSLKIEVLYESLKPDAHVLNNLKLFLQNRLHKPEGIEIVTRKIPESGNSVLSLEEVKSMEKKYRKSYNTGSRIAVCVLYVDADYTDDHVLGIAYLNTSVCLFGKTIASHSGGIGQTSTATLATTVLEHEFGHLLGLVNIGSKMQTNHVDPDHPHHCDNKNCLMYYASETTDILGFLVAGNTPKLDANCLADLKANGGK